MLYLSDAIRGEYVQDEFNVIEAPCGCGKTEYAVNKLPYEILGSKPQFNKVLYLIDTCAGRHSIVAKHPEKARCYDNIIDNGGRRFDGFDANRIVVITYLVSNKENIDTSTPTGRLMLTMIGAINEFERCNLLERQREGIAIAKAQGKFKGRKEVKADDFAAQYQRYLNRELNKAQLAKTLGISRPTLDKLIRQHTTA